MPQNKFKKQAGNAFVLILAGVFLFGALMFTFSRSAQKGTGSLTKQQAKIFAQEIISYAQTLEGAVNRVRNNGCSENQISFVNAVVTGYSNTNAPVDGSCDVFNDAGGKIEYITPNNLYFDSSSTGYNFKGGYQIEGVGTNNTDLILQLAPLKKEVCVAINSLLNITNPGNDAPIDDNVAAGFGLFDGAFGPGVADTLNDDGTGLTKQPMACRSRSSGTNRQFYHVLLAR